MKVQTEKIPKKVHMIAVCGTGMGALALLMREAGVHVTGSDLQSYPPMGDMLRDAGVEILQGFRAENVPGDTDYVVVGNAVSRDNPEVEAVLGRGLPHGSFPEALARYFLCERKPVVVVGTHGKTTTTSLLAWLLAFAGMEPGFLVGGEPKNFGASSRLGKGPYFVVEGDEYDSAFFEKEPKFLRYHPRMALFTSLEFDHADIYPDLASLRREFARFVKLLPPEGLLLVCREYPDAVEIASEASCRVETYGYHDDAHWRGVLREGPSETLGLEVYSGEEPMGLFPLPLAGRHNGLNILGSLGLLLHIGIPSKVLKEGLGKFLGVRRRQEVIEEVGGILLVDDFAHHPTAVKETIKAMRMRYPGRRLCAVFEPRTHTSRRNIFQKEYAEAFEEADLAVCTSVFRADTVAPSDRFNVELWARDLKAKGKEAFCVDSMEDLKDFLSGKCRAGDIVLFMSSGNLVNLINMLREEIKVNS